jgi:putative addiction module CopG family antidote
MADDYVEIEIELTPAQRHYIDRAVAAGHYPDANTLICEALRMALEQDERRLAERAAQLAAASLRGPQTAQADHVEPDPQMRTR